MALVGSNQLILTDGLSKKQISGSPGQGRQSLQWTGRTSTNKIVNFSQDEKSTNTESLMGKLVDVQIEKALAHSLIGKAINVEPSSGGLKGASYYAA
jgi:tRNA-2-methylthio-N6-dimethylallyladenosine synthase